MRYYWKIDNTGEVMSAIVIKHAHLLKVLIDTHHGMTWMGTEG